MVANSGTQNSSIAGDPSPANVLGEVKQASANSGSARCRSAQWTARRIISTSVRSAAFFWSPPRAAARPGCPAALVRWSMSWLQPIRDHRHSDPRKGRSDRDVDTTFENFSGRRRDWFRDRRRAPSSTSGRAGGASSTSGRCCRLLNQRRPRAWFRDRRQGAFLNQRAGARRAFLNQRKGRRPSSTSEGRPAAFLDRRVGRRGAGRGRPRVTAWTSTPPTPRASRGSPPSPAGRDRGPGGQRRARSSRRRGRPRGARRGRGVPRAGAERLLDRRPVPAGRPARRGAARRSTPSSTASADLLPVLVVGAPLVHGNRVYNCAVVIHRGEVLGVAPKSYLPNYREFYERRWFAPGDDSRGEFIDARRRRGARSAPTCSSRRPTSRGSQLHVEVCEDFWVPIPPSAEAALAGATVLANLSGSPITVGPRGGPPAAGAQRERPLLAAYVYAAAGQGESTTDLSWDGQTMVYECGDLLAEGERFPDGRRAHGRRRRPRPAAAGAAAAGQLRRQPARRRRRRASSASSSSSSSRPSGDIGLRRKVDRFPFVPDDPERLALDCYEAYNIQVSGARAADRGHRRSPRRSSASAAASTRRTH